EDRWNGCWISGESPVLKRVDENVPGYKAGLRVGMLIVGVDNRLFRNSTTSPDMISMLTPASKVWVTNEQKRERIPLLNRIEDEQDLTMVLAVIDFIVSMAGVLILAVSGVWSDNVFSTLFFLCVGPIVAHAKKFFPPLSSAKLMCNALWILRIAPFNLSWGSFSSPAEFAPCSLTVGFTVGAHS
ncbi:hypothetical protein PFISCL1PPCAC_8977, partial [Pristionchus fissidentatus]